MKERKNIFKRIGYLLMVITLTIVAFLAPRFIEKEVNAEEEISTTLRGSDTIAPTIEPVLGVAVNTEDASTWTAPPTRANDDIDGDISDYIVVTYFKADETQLLNEEEARIALYRGRSVVVKYNVKDAAGNKAVEVSATFTAIDNTFPVIEVEGYEGEVDDFYGNVINVYINLEIEDVSNWTAPTMTVTDNIDKGLTADIAAMINYDDDYLADFAAVKAELKTYGTVQIAYIVYDTAGNRSAVVLGLRTDYTAPVIEPVDGAIVDLEETPFWKAPTTTAIDDIDGDISDSIYLTHSRPDGKYIELFEVINELKAGRTVVVTYRVRDAAGNEAEKVSATFTVINTGSVDITPPVIEVEGFRKDHLSAVNFIFVEMENALSWTAPIATVTENIDTELIAVVTYYSASFPRELIDLATARTELYAGRGVNLEYNVSDAAGNVAITRKGFVYSDDEAPVIEPIDDTTVETEDISTWEAPIATVTVIDNIDTGLRVYANYLKADGIRWINLDIARTELAAGRAVVVRYDAEDRSYNEAAEVFATFTPAGLDNELPVIEPIDDATVITEDSGTWKAPTATAKDYTGVDISDRVEVTYFKADGTTSLVNLTAAIIELETAGNKVIVKYNVTDAAGNKAVEVSATFRARTLGTPTITRGNWILEGSNWTLAQQYVFTTNEPIVEYSLDGGKFVAITPSFKGEYTIYIGDNLPHRLLLKSVEGDVGDTFPIQAKTTGNDNLMFYASKGLLPWDSDANWQFNGAGAITPDIFDEDGNCKQEYGNGAACYKIYELDVAGEQVKVLQQLDDSSTAILQTVRLLDKDDYNNLYSNGGVVRGRVIVPAQNTYAGNFQEGYGAFVGLQFEAEMITGSSSNRRYGLNITYSGEYVEIATVDGSVILNGNAGVPAIGISRTVKAPKVKAGDSFDFVIHIPKTAGAIGRLPKAEIYINKTFVGKTNFNTFGGGSKGNKVIISSGSTGGTNREILIENFGSVINTGAYDVSVPIFGGASVVNDSVYTFESDERLTGYQVNDENWITVKPTFKITDIHLRNGQNGIRVRDRSGNIATYTVYYDVGENTPFFGYIPITTVDFP